jgi:GTPase involved in cell partitioning and DNA repair
MKTAMQELEEKLKDNLKWIVMNADYELMDKLFKEALEKEKEQIIDAMEKTAMYVSAASLDKEIGKMNFEDFYNQTYNQNK